MSVTQDALDDALAIGVDVGGTKVIAGLVDAGGNVLARARRDTPGRTTEASVVEDVIVDTVTEIQRTAAVEHPSRPVLGVGLGAAGFVSADRSTVVFAPHLAWRDEPIRDRLVERLATPVVLDNDANAAAWAEFRFGAGQAEPRLLLVTLGTGIGGALVLDGRVERGRHGLAGEYGHMQVVPDGIRCQCGNRGCWEQYASGNALMREARALVAARSPIAMDMVARVNGDPGIITGPLVTEAAKEGDRMAIELLAEIGTWLGIGMANLAAAFDPGRFVVGGGVSAAGDLLLQPARDAFAKQLTGRGYRPEATIIPAHLGNDAGLIGAADLARASVE